MRGMPGRRTIVTAALLALVALAGASGCSDDKDKPAAKSGGDLPAGDGLLRESATAMKAVETVKFTIEITGKPGGVPLRKVEGQLAKAGNAKGKVQLDQAGTLSELEYVVLGTTAYIKGPTGGWQSVPLSVASTVYDPSAILDPERGISKLLETASGGHTEAREESGGVDAYRVAASFGSTVVGALVPGFGVGASGQVWIGVKDKLPVRIKLQMPATEGGEASTVLVNLTDYNAPASISAPV
jgi:lipoprotein LprG